MAGGWRRTTRLGRLDSRAFGVVPLALIEGRLCGATAGAAVLAGDTRGPVPSQRDGPRARL